MLIVNLVVYILEKSDDNVSQTAVIVILSVVGAVLGVPLLGFFCFHLYLACSGRTTHEVIK